MEIEKEATASCEVRPAPWSSRRSHRGDVSPGVDDRDVLRDV